MNKYNENQKKFLENLKIQPICHYDIPESNLGDIFELEKLGVIEKFIDNGACLFPNSIIYKKDSYYWKLKK